MSKVILVLAQDLQDLRTSAVESVIATVRNVQKEYSDRASAGTGNDGIGRNPQENSQPSTPVTSPVKISPTFPSEPPQRSRIPDVYLMIAGSKRHASHVNAHDVRSDRSEWDKSWTAGEQFFSEVCDGLGLNSFAPGAGLEAKLIDVSFNGGTKEIAAEVLRVLKRKFNGKVAEVVVLHSPYELTPPSQSGEAMETARQTFTDAWTGHGENMLGSAALGFVTWGKSFEMETDNGQREMTF